MEIRIKEQALEITNYPFSGSCLQNNQIINVSNIIGADLNANPMQLRLESEIIFIDDEHRTWFTSFVNKNNIKEAKQSELWNWIALPVCLGFDDSIFNYYEKLSAFGIEREIVDTVRFIISILIDDTKDFYYEKHSIYNVLMQCEQSEFWKDRSIAFYKMIMQIVVFEKEQVTVS